MIFDAKENLDSYSSLSENFACAVDFLKTADLKSLEPGKIEIKGKEVYANVLAYETIPWDQARFEAHDHYADIQYMIEGREVMSYVPKKLLTPKDEYNPEKDVIHFTNDIHGVDLPTGPDEYCIFLAQDGHKVKSMDREPMQIKKIVVKVKLD